MEQPINESANQRVSASAAPQTPDGRPAVRPARVEDAEPIAVLSGQLGYPTPAEVTARRLAILLADPEHAVFVAEWPGTGVVGWVHVCLRPLLILEAVAEVEGLVVDASHRSQGVGHQLLAAAERWAHEHGCTATYLRSNARREAAHRFYQREGYQIIKTQFGFWKTL